MNRIQELIIKYSNSRDNAVMHAIIEELQKREKLWSAYSLASKNHYIQFHEGLPTAYLFSEIEFCDAFREYLLDSSKLFMFGSRLCALPEAGLPALTGLKVIRAGLELGEIRKGRFIPAHSLALAISRESAMRVLELDNTGEEAERYLAGGTLTKESGRYHDETPEGKAFTNENAGWGLVTVSGISIGWYKASNDIFKNHYPKGLRIF